MQCSCQAECLPYRLSRAVYYTAYMAGQSPQAKSLDTLQPVRNFFWVLTLTQLYYIN